MFYKVSCECLKLVCISHFSDRQAIMDTPHPFPESPMAVSDPSLAFCHYTREIYPFGSLFLYICLDISLAYIRLLSLARPPVTS